MSVIPARLHRGRLRAALAAGTALLGGCYGYVQQPHGAPLAGTEAQLWLSDSGSVVLASTIGPQVEAITGRVVADSSGDYVVSLATVRRRGGEETEWRGERIAVAHALVIDTGTRRFSPSRTALFSGIMSVGLLAARQAFLGRGSGGGGGGIGGHTGAQ